MKPQRTTSARYDITGHSVRRVLKDYLLFRLLPPANFDGGPAFKFLVELWCLHTFARRMFALRLRLEKPAALLARAVRSWTRRGR